MNETALLIFDQIRSNLGILVAYFLFCNKLVPKKQAMKSRLAVGILANIAMAFAWLPIYKLLQEEYIGFMWTGYLYFLLNCLLMMGTVMFCYEISLSQATFYCIGGSAMNVPPNIILRYLLVNMWLPELPKRHFLLYLLLWLVIYGVCYSVEYYFLIRRIGAEAGNGFDRVKRSGGIGIALFLGFNFSVAIIQMISEYVIKGIYMETLLDSLTLINYFLAIVMIVYASLVMVMIYFIFGRLILQHEKTVVHQLINERQMQYTFTKENMDLINRKSHDLKHQLSAIEIASEDERKEIIQEAKKAVDMYDSVFATGNDVLDTILTEKSILCQNRKIRLSCIVKPGNLERIRVVDLYTLLGNALDNAIESVSALADEEKRVISVRVENRGEMIHILVENYFQGTVKMVGGQPVTSKKDKENHGFGIKSMQMIAKKYGGHIRIFTENQLFSLQILLAP